MKPLGHFLFQNNQYFVHLPISCWLFPSNDILSYSHSNALATHVDLAINWVKVISAFVFTVMIYIYIVVLEPLVIHAKFP